MHERARQRGLSMIGFLFVAVVAVVCVMIGFRVTPAYIEYYSVKKALQDALYDVKNVDSPAEIRSAFQKRADAGYIESVTGKDVDVVKNKNEITASASWTRTLPLVGTEGSLSDLETALVEFEPPAGALVTTQLLVADGTPSAVVDRVRAAGIGLGDPRSIDGTLRELRGDAFSLGLLLFLVVGVATLLIAILGVFASAVLQSRWRSYEVAALRVVGVSQRTLVRASVLEYVVLLGVAVLLGVLSAYLSLKLVLPSISLGTSGVHDPQPVYATPWLLIIAVGGGLFLLATLIAVLVSRRITRLGRPSTLRWAEQG